MTPEARANKILSDLWTRPWIGRSHSFPQGWPKDANEYLVGQIREAVEEAVNVKLEQLERQLSEARTQREQLRAACMEECEGYRAQIRELSAKK